MSAEPLDHLLEPGECVVGRVVVACSSEGCAGVATRRFLCSTCYSRYLRLGLPMPPSMKPQPRACSIEGCETRATRRGWCTSHYDRWRTHGDPDIPLRHGGPRGERHRRWVGDNVGWAGLHDRLKHRRGKANEYACVDCGGQAAEWSYDHDDPNERPSDHGPYSLDYDHYDPRCVRCHRRFDLGKPGAVAQHLMLCGEGE